MSVADAAANVRFWNRRRSMSGSVVRSAWKANATSSATPIRPGTSTSLDAKPPPELDFARP